MFNYLGGRYKMYKIIKINNLKIIFSSFWSVVKNSFDVCLAELWHLKIIHKWRHTERGRQVDVLVTKVHESFVMSLLGYLVDWLVKVGVLLLFRIRIRMIVKLSWNFASDWYLVSWYLDWYFCRLCLCICGGNFALFLFSFFLDLLQYFQN